MRRTRTYCISLLLALAVANAAAQPSAETATFRFDRVALSASLDSLMRWFPVSIVYRDRDVEGKTVTASCGACDLESALNRILEGTSLMWIRTGNQVVLKPRPPETVGPRGSVSGVVVDSLTGESLAGVIVLLKDSAAQEYRTVRRWCPTNAAGFYALRGVSPGTYLLAIRALGYRPALLAVHVTGGESLRLDVGLVEEKITLQEVMVEGRRSAVLTSQGFTRGIYVRATPSDQTEYLLDGARIYNPTHFGGVLSAFNEEALNDVQLMPGGLPPYYGGRIGGVMDLSMRDGTRERVSGSIGLGSLGTRFSVEGPLADRTTFLLSGRRGYPEPAVPFLEGYGAPGRLGISELTAKLTHRLAPGDQIFVNGYMGKDSYDNAVSDNGVNLSNNFSWGNSALNLGWTAIVSPSVFVRVSAGYTRYDLSLQHGLSTPVPVPPEARFSSEYEIEDLSLRAHAEHFYDQEHTVRGGVELVRHRTGGYVSEFSTRTGHMSLDGPSFWELSVYLQDQWKLFPGVMAEIGARATTFSDGSATLSSVDPRFSLLASVSQWLRVYGSLTSINQYLHPYRNTGVFLFYPARFWYPSGETVKPSGSLQVTLGAETGDETFRASAESFYRTTSNLHGFGIDTAGAWQTDLSDQILYGNGRSYGVELSVQKRTGELTGSATYTLSWVREQFAELNGGEPYAPRTDRRHELQLSALYIPSEEWASGILAVLASGESTSMDPPVLKQVADYLAAQGIEDVNGGQLPGFQRFELSASRRFDLPGVRCLLSLRLVNAYGLVDPYIWNLRANADPRLMWSASLDELKLFPLFPTLELNVRF